LDGGEGRNLLHAATGEDIGEELTKFQ